VGVERRLQVLVVQALEETDVVWEEFPVPPAGVSAETNANANANADVD
jgi:hypothetical protein